MKAIMLIVPLLFGAYLGYAQNRSFGVQFGSGNSNDDIATSYSLDAFFLEMRPQIGFVTRKKISDALSWKTALNFARFSGADSNHTNPSRNLAYKTSTVQFGNQLEWNYFRNETVLLYSGVGLNLFYLFPPVAISSGEETSTLNLGGMNGSVYYATGWRVSLNGPWNIGGEFSYHFSTTDYMDAHVIPSNGYEAKDRFYHFTVEITRTIGTGRGRSGSNECPVF